MFGHVTEKPYLCSRKDKSKTSIMKIVSRFKDNSDGRLLVIYETPSGNLVGEVYADGVYKRGGWNSRATFRWQDKDASEYRVREYFGFLKNSVTQINK